MNALRTSLDALWGDPALDEVMLVGPDVWLHRRGGLEQLTGVLQADGVAAAFELRRGAHVGPALVLACGGTQEMPVVRLGRAPTRWASLDDLVAQGVWDAEGARACVGAFFRGDPVWVAGPHPHLKTALLRALALLAAARVPTAAPEWPAAPPRAALPAAVLTGPTGVHGALALGAHALVLPRLSMEEAADVLACEGQALIALGAPGRPASEYPCAPYVVWAAYDADGRPVLSGPPLAQQEHELAAQAVVLHASAGSVVPGGPVLGSPAAHAPSLDGAPSAARPNLSDAGLSDSSLSDSSLSDPRTGFEAGLPPEAAPDGWGADADAFDPGWELGSPTPFDAVMEDVAARPRFEPRLGAPHPQARALEQAARGGTNSEGAPGEDPFAGLSFEPPGLPGD